MSEDVSRQHKLRIGESPDPRTAELAIEAHRQSLLVAQSPSGAEDQAFIDSITVDLWEDDDWDAQVQQ